MWICELTIPKQNLAKVYLKLLKILKSLSVIIMYAKDKIENCHKIVMNNKC